jgi:hypothetical protein
VAADAKPSAVHANVFNDCGWAAAENPQTRVGMDQFPPCLFQGCWQDRHRQFFPDVVTIAPVQMEWRRVTKVTGICVASLCHNRWCFGGLDAHHCSAKQIRFIQWCSLTTSSGGGDNW